LLAHLEDEIAEKYRAVTGTHSSGVQEHFIYIGLT
jgi:hypothetical protein